MSIVFICVIVLDINICFDQDLAWNKYIWSVYFYVHLKVFEIRRICSETILVQWNKWISEIDLQQHDF